VEYDSNQIATFAAAGQAVGAVLLVLGIIVGFIRRSYKWNRQVLIVVGALSIPASWFMAFPLSNRDHPLTWFVLCTCMFGGGLGMGLLICALTARRQEE
jgi:hypothetical protein